MDFPEKDRHQQNDGSENMHGLPAAKAPDDCEVIILHTDKKTAPLPGGDIHAVRKNVAASLLGDGAPLVSVVVVGYNNLEEHTKTCVECILTYTKDVDYELILVDNGSSDETLAYFKAVPHPAKKIVRVTKNLGALYGGRSGMALAGGAYVVGVSNDVYVTKNWLSNMLACAMSDDRIGMIGPMSNNVSNFQSVDFDFTDFQDMQKKAGEFNSSSPAKWHERLRIVSPIAFFSKACLDMIGTHDYGFLHDFSDDDITFRVRRAGYKAILCKDVFVCHAGHTAQGSRERLKDRLEKGRDAFRDKYYGIDAWTDVNNYEPAMISLISPGERRGAGAVEVLGMDVLCGTPLLEVKNKLREADLFDVRLSAFATEAKYWLDLKTICRGTVAVDRPEHLLEHFEPEKFDYMVLGRPVNGYKDPYGLLENMLGLLKKGGHLLLKLRNTYDAKALLEMLGIRVFSDNTPLYQISLEALASRVEKHGCACRAIFAEAHRTDENTTNFIKKSLEQLDIPNRENSFNRMFACDYVVDIARL